MEKYKYYARLVNKEGIMFSVGYFKSIKDAKKWAKDRSETDIYDFSLYYANQVGGDIKNIYMYYYVKNNKIYAYK